MVRPTARDTGMDSFVTTLMSDRMNPFLSFAIVGASVLLSACVPASVAPPTSTESAAPTTSAAASAVTQAPTARPSASPTPAGTFENPLLGYRITFPAGYRRSSSRIITGQEAILGNDFYTLRSERAEREECLSDAGDIGPNYPQRESNVGISVARNLGGVSVVEWVNTPQSPGAQPLSMHRKVEALSIGGREAVRLVADNASAQTMLFVIRANDRMYVISPDFWSQPSPLPKNWLEDIANSFVAMTPAAFPSPTPTAAPRVAARALADELLKAFGARDAAAVARLMPSCWLAVYPLVDGRPPGGVLNRSVASFTQGLAARFAAGDLTVTVDPTLVVTTDGGGEHFFVRSEWREPDRTTKIDLELRPGDGRWEWGAALHNYTVTEMQTGNCVLGRVPWSPTTTMQGWC